jgi:hypothetical protein
MGVLALILRTLGLPVCIIIALLGYYEGVPFLRDIPFADRIPVVRELITGRVATEKAKAASAAREGFVALSEKTALEAQLAKERRDNLLASQLYDEAIKRAAAAQQAKKVADEKLAKIILEDTGADGAVWSADDLQWLRNH